MLIWNRKKEVFLPGNMEFALHLLRNLFDPQANFFIAPYNLRVLLAMVYAGARRETAVQMAKALHFPADHAQLHPQMTDLNQQILASSQHGHYELHIGNRIWSQAGYPLLQSFLDMVATHYQSVVEQVDFSQSERTCQVMNRWIEDQTAGLIKNLVNPGMISPVTRVFLTSAIYFKGLWLEPFRKESTRDEEFWVSSKRTVRTPMMRHQVEVPYAENSEVQVVNLPYRYLGDETQPDVSMIVVLPRTRGELDNLSTQLHPGQLGRWVDSLKSQKVQIFLPKFRIESLHRLKNLLMGLGMVNAFDPATADFSGMTQAKELFWIADLIQKAYVNVGEEGTEAAAVSMALYLGYTASPRPRPPIPVFRADHPFLFFIRHNPTGSILFMGRLNNPQEG